MLTVHTTMIKVVVDVRCLSLAGGGDMHADCESALLEGGSDQEDLWGANWFPGDERIEFESLINIRPAQGNRGLILKDERLRAVVESVTRNLLGGVE